MAHANVIEGRRVGESLGVRAECVRPLFVKLVALLALTEITPLILEKASL
jgi:hypothetical protein